MLSGLRPAALIYASERYPVKVPVTLLMPLALIEAPVSNETFGAMMSLKKKSVWKMDLP